MHDGTKNISPILSASTVSTRTLYISAFVVLLAYMSPNLLLGEQSYVRIPDQLDCAFAWLKVLTESGKIFAAPTATIENVMNGAPRASYLTEFNVIVWLFYFLEPFHAYVANQFLIRVIGFLGMFVLLRTYVLKNEKPPIVAFGAALSFALLPYYSLFGLTIAGQPLVLNAFLNVRGKSANWKDWLVVALVPLYSIFGLSYAFLLCAMTGLWLYECIRERKSNRALLGAIALMLIVSLLVEYRALIATLSPSMGFVSHRTEMTPGITTSFSDFLKNSTLTFIEYGHAASHHLVIILPTVAMAAFVIHLRKVKVPLFAPILLLIALTAYWDGVWTFLAYKIMEVWRGIPMLNLGRFVFLVPLLWYVLFALALQTLWRHMKSGRTLVLILLAGQIAYLCSQSEHFTQKRPGAASLLVRTADYLLYGDRVTRRQFDDPRYGEF
jgi:hypothetical protein